VYVRGKIDTLVAQARINAAVFCRTRGGELQAGSPTNRFNKSSGAGSSGSPSLTWNGKSNQTAAKCCVAFNLGKKHGAAALADEWHLSFRTHVHAVGLRQGARRSMPRRPHERSLQLSV
jgi:hypothetical protein